MIALALSGWTPPTAAAQPPDTERAALAAFASRVDAYARMHRRLESQIGLIEFGMPIEEVHRITGQLAAAIRAERYAARQGDFFTPDLAHVLRARIYHALLDHHYSGDDVRAASRVDSVDYGQVKLKVNETFPWILATGMFACVIEALPALPPELQYRMVSDDLLLIDIHAALIVDILPQALADRTAQLRPRLGGVR